MRKKFLKVSASILMLSSMGLIFPSCSDDYDDDISRLEQEIATNTAAIQQIQQLVKSGNLITDVTSSANGVTVTLSNGKTFEITNGTNGTPGTVWTIGDDGYWYENGEKTEFLARGEKGDKGDTGAQGEKGDTGAQGEKGEKGDTGAQGPAGAAGAQGPAGAAGATGATGAAGAQGPAGPAGAAGPQGPQGEKGDSIYYVPNADGFFHRFVNGNDEGQTEISWKTSGVTAAVTDDDVIFSNIEGYEGTFIISRSNVLRSLVFKPQLYLDGIEALEAATYHYDIQLVEKLDVNGNNSKDAPTKPDKDPKEIDMTPGLWATYSMNPSNVDFSKLFDFAFICEDYKFVVATRSSNSSISPKIYKQKDNEDGTFTVYASYTGKIIAAKDTVTTIALQVSQTVAGDTATITSDYAAIYTVKETIEKLAAPEEVKDKITLEKENNHWFESAAEAIEGDAAIKVPYNSTVDLAEYVHTHVTIDGEEHQSLDKNALDGKANNAGFKYVYELAGYTAGDNGTQESAHAALQGSILRPQMPDKDGKQQAFGATQSIATVGRMPLVRVTLVDTLNNHVAAVGYIKVEIAEASAVAEEEKTITMPAFTDGYTMECNAEETKFEYTWMQIETILLDACKISKADFENNYELDLKDDSEAKQFTLKDNVYTPAQDDEYFGTVKENKNEGGSTTNVLSWTIKENDIYKFFASKEKPTEAHVFVCFKPTGAGANIYIELVWTPNAINVGPKGSLTGKNDFWYKKWSGSVGTDEVHFNVRTPQSNSDDDPTHCTFATKLGSSWIGDMPSSTADDTYDGFDKIMYHFVINEDVEKAVGASGTEYVLLLDNGGKDTLWAALASDPEGNKQMVARIAYEESENSYTDQTGDDPTKATIIYQENEWAKDLLNVADHKVFDNIEKTTFTAAVGVSIEDGCNHQMELDNAVYNIRFCRPISGKIKPNDGLTDGIDGGDEIELKDVLTFVDWRDYTFAASNGYFGFYGIERIGVAEWTSSVGWQFEDADDITGYATMASGTGKGKTVKEYNSFIDLQFVEAESSPTLTDMGRITYKNNGHVIPQDYDIEIPFVVKYKWGYVKVPVTITIHATIGQD